MLTLMLLGYDNVRNYDGSWGEWGNDPSFPIEGRTERSEDQNEK
jgi:3-mercaptopyruvate sulfurtransferase SseA